MVLRRVADTGDTGEIEAGVQRQAFDFAAEMEMVGHVHSNAGFGLIIRLCWLPDAWATVGGSPTMPRWKNSITCCWEVARSRPQGWETSFYPAGNEENRLPWVLCGAVRFR